MAGFWKEYVALLHDWPHYAFELTLMIVFDGLILGIVWPLMKKAVRREVIEHEGEHGITHNDKVSVRDKV